MFLISIKESNMFKWDGTDVSNIISEADIFEATYNRKKYWLIRYVTNHKIKEEICMVKYPKDTLTCLVDELKAIFGLVKIGTHWFVRNNRLGVLIKCFKTKEGYIKEEPNLSQITKVDQLLTLQVQEIFAFRDLLGVTCSYESSIIVRETRIGKYPISYFDPNMTLKNTKVVPATVLDKWFKNTSLDDVTRRLVKINDINELSAKLHDIRSQIETVIERVDRRSIVHKTIIIDRITERLQATLI